MIQHQSDPGTVHHHVRRMPTRVKSQLQTEIALIFHGI